MRVVRIRSAVSSAYLVIDDKVILRDVTERRKAEAEQEERRLAGEREREAERRRAEEESERKAAAERLRADLERARAAERRREVGKVQAILMEEIERFQLDRTMRTVAPLVASLRSRGEEVRIEESEMGGTCGEGWAVVNH